MKGKCILSFVIMASLLFTGIPCISGQASESITDVGFENSQNTILPPGMEQPIQENVIAYIGENTIYGNSAAFEVKEDVYNNGLQIENTNPTACDVSVSYASAVGMLSVKFLPSQEGETDIFIRDKEGTLLKEYKVTSAYRERLVYLTYPVDHEVETGTNPSEDQWNAEVQDPSLCDVQFYYDDETSWGSADINLHFEGKQPGETFITIYCDGEQRYLYHVTVAELPDNIVRFEDKNLWYALGDIYASNGYVDANDDIYISKEELEELENVPTGLVNMGITNLTGLEYAVNLKVLSLYGNTGLQNVNELYKLNQLTYVNLTNTAVGQKDRLSLANVKDTISLNRGNSESLLGIEIEEEQIQTEIVSGEDVISFLPQPSKPGGYDTHSVLALKGGEAVVRVSCGDNFSDVKIHVDGKLADQPVGETSDMSLNGAGEHIFLDSMGRLWETEPEIVLRQTDVKQIVNGWIYGVNQDDGRQRMDYVIDQDNTLWFENKKLAEHVKEVKGRYALNEENVLMDVYRNEPSVMENVQKWTEIIVILGQDESTGKNVYQGVTYVLKNDQTLWRRVETDLTEKSSEFIQIDDQVIDLDENRYLKADGTLISDDSRDNSQEVYGIDLSELPRGDCFRGLDGQFYLGQPLEGGEQICVGLTRIISAYRVPELDSDTSQVVFNYYYLTEDGDLFKYSGKDGHQKLASQVLDLTRGQAWPTHIADSGAVIYLSSDGLYRDLSGKAGSEDTPIYIGTYGNLKYLLEDVGKANDYRLSRDGVQILNHVKNVFDNGAGTIFMVRTDGTVWKLEYDGIPEQILDLNNAADNSEMTETQKQEIVAQIQKENAGETVSVDMASAVILPADIVGVARDKEITLECILSDGTKWSISCGALTDEQLTDIDLTVIKAGKENGTIPAEIITELAGTRPAEQLNFTDGGFDLVASISLAVDSTFKNMKCVALDLEEDTEKLLGVAMVKDEQMTLALAQTKDCALVYGVNGDTSADDRVNITDLMQTLHHVSGRTVFGVVEQGISDVNLNGRTDITDLMQMLHYTSGRNETL